MNPKVFLAAGLIAALGFAQVQAQAQQGSGASEPVSPSSATRAPASVTRVPALGDTSRSTRRVTRRRPVLPPQNGNAPARASAGAGGR